MITTVIPVYNTRIEWLKECFNSISNQTLQTPVLVIDDGSTDRTVLSYLQASIDSRKNWRLITQRNSGICGAMNTAISNVDTEWILKIDSDDIALPELTRTLQEYAYRNSDIAAVCSQLNSYERGVFRLRSEHPEFITPEYVYNHKDHWIMNHTGVLLNRYALISCGGYPEYRQSFSEDYELWITLLLNGEQLRSIPDYLLNYRYVGVGSLSHMNKNSRNDKFLEGNRRKLLWLK